MMDWGILVLRIGLGVMFAAHGLQKAFGLWEGPGIGGFTQMLSNLGLSPASLLAYAAAYIELLGGLFLIIGLFVRGSSLLLLVVMSVAAWKVHIARGFFLAAGGFEYIFLIISVCIALIIMGPGRFTLMKRF